VNGVCPGFITPIMERAIDKGGFTDAEVIAGEPIGCPGKPEEIAEGILWLLSDASSFVTGHPLTIGGGWVAR
jgi:NAD(P)-dependent dehydrogenase (short-subunit alcohol dehydrogenase family)